MIEIVNSNYSVAVPISRYDKLCDMETMIDGVVKLIMGGDCNNMESTLRLLGTSLVSKRICELLGKGEIKNKEYIGMMGGEKIED